ncbi:MFS transporter [Anaerobium acetethylicum]|uniref:Major Facilitator Superfamily protein n=1 Tax=Anaerobium acetethylicum TaxID=1619234 RepID=A0A1D3TR70_9FIRM|nr:MFS transporter [Anaerobium acetethylicum]SCP96167.1 Major Facilitator Superfamily protein [Anaerobium acetethylicum]
MAYLTATIRKHFTDTYFSRRPLSEADYSRSRNLFILEGVCANGIFTLTSGAFLSGYVASLGADESLNGIIGSIPTLLCATQLFSSVVIENLKQKKFLIAIMALIHRLLLAGMFFIPFFVQGIAARITAMIIMFSVSHFCGTFIGTGAGNWILQLLANNNVGSYLGKKDAYALGAATLISLVMGKVLDNYRSSGAELFGFAVIGIAALAIAFTNFYCLSSIKEPASEIRREKVNLKDVLTKPLAHKGFRKIILFYVFWNLALQIAGPFFSIYMVTGLKLDYFYITTVGLLSSAARVGAAIIWGQMADKKSWLWVTKASIALLGVIHFCWFFLTQESYVVLMPVLQVFSGIAWGGIAIAMFNIQYAFAPLENRVIYVSANTSYAGICGFAASLCGALLLKLLPDMAIGGFTGTGMQMLFAISGILMIGCVLFIRIVLEKNR